MVEPIESIASVKRKKTSQAVYQPILWVGASVPTQFLKIIFEGGRRVVEASMNKAREIRQDHDLQRNQAHYRRFLQSVDLQRKLFNRDVVIIH